MSNFLIHKFHKSQKIMSCSVVNSPLVSHLAIGLDHQTKSTVCECYSYR